MPSCNNMIQQKFKMLFAAATESILPGVIMKGDMKRKSLILDIILKDKSTNVSLLQFVLQFLI